MSLRLRDVTGTQRRTLIAASLGWMLDAFDVMLYALVLAHIMRDLGMTKATAGLLNTLTLLASGLGGILFGLIADRIGRTRALIMSILTYSVCSFASGLAPSIAVLAAFRFVLGLGMGGEWNTGATLVAETWPDHLRARALAIVQSSWAIGYAAAAVVSGLVLRFYNWRVVFFIGILPALVTLWIRKDVPESEMWRERRASADATNVVNREKTRLSVLFSSRYRKSTIALLLMNFLGLFAYWGLFSWVPAYLQLPESQGGRGFGLMSTTQLLLVLNLVGMLPGYLAFGYFADKLGRKKAFILYFLAAAALVPIYGSVRQQWLLLVVGALVGFFGTGFFSGSGLVGSEIFPTQVRARALGLTYNGARTFSAVAPYVIGRAGQTRGLGGAFFVCAAAFLLAALAAATLPETKGKKLD
ncbi:MAG: MFS transporter [Terriglobales bacterium]